MAVIGQDGPRRKPAASQVNKVPQRSAIMHLRYRPCALQYGIGIWISLCDLVN